ncbi:Eisosome component PIL1-domain-containing protein [Obelidium mucronatum]|nr:Eisosome component PIL1-domain-containing protein [Obelidium mucronatum]
MNFWKKKEPSDEQPLPPTPPPAGSGAASSGAAAASSGAAASHSGLGDVFSAGLRKTIATFKNHDSKDLELFIKEERDVVVAAQAVANQRRGATDYFYQWAGTKEEDVRSIAKKWCDIQHSFIVAESEYIESLEQSRLRMKVIRNREKGIGDAKQKLKAAISKRDAAEKKQVPADEINKLKQDARDIQGHIMDLEAEHLGMTRLDLREALRIKHEACLKYAVKMSVASKFSLYLADQIPQGQLLAGQSLPPFANHETLERIVADFTDAFASNELVTVVRTEVPAPAIQPMALPAAIPERAPSPSGSLYSSSAAGHTANATNAAGGMTAAEPAVVYAASRPENYNTLTHRVSNINLQERQPSPAPQQPTNPAPPAQTYAVPYQPGYYNQYLPQQPAPQPQQQYVLPSQTTYRPPYAPQQPIIYPGPPPPASHQQVPPPPPQQQQQQPPYAGGYGAVPAPPPLQYQYSSPPPQQAQYPGPPPPSHGYQGNSLPPPPPNGPPTGQQGPPPGYPEPDWGERRE